MSPSMMLVDGNNMLRSAMAVRMDHGLSNELGVATGPLVIFINRLARYVRELRPYRVLVAWDHSGPNRRVALYPEYKGNRAPAPDEEREARESHFNLAKEFCAVADVPHLAVPGHEADDLIAAGWRATSAEAGVETIYIVSNDGDFGQLVGPNPHGIDTVQVRLTPRRSDLDRLTAERVCTEMGVCQPSDLASIKVLTGDVSDNIAGIRGIGPKRALKLLEDNDWSLDEIISGHPEWKDLIVRNNQLINLRIDSLSVRAPLWRPTKHTSHAYQALVNFLVRYELHQILSRVQAGTLWTEGDEDLFPIGRRLTRRGTS